MTSPDGITWTGRVPAWENSLYAVAFGNNTFVAVGERGTILQSGAMPPVLGPLSLLSSDRVQAPFTGQASQTYCIQASSNLTQWLIITNVALTNASGQFVDSAMANFPQRFYRAKAILP